MAGAVLLRMPIAGLRDSKKLSRLQRERLEAIICLEAAAFGLGWVSPAEVDKLGLTQAVRLAMQRAMECITVPYAEIIIDGNYNYLADNPKSRCLVKADTTVPAVSAASIIAKVARDAYMRGIARSYPGYGFESHVGYGTAVHRSALQQLGACDLHRSLFTPIRNLLEHS